MDKPIIKISLSEKGNINLSFSIITVKEWRREGFNYIAS